MVKVAITVGQPAISVDTTKKDLVADFKNGGREYQPGGSPEPVRVRDFIDLKFGRAAPYGVYDIANDKGCLGEWLRDRHCVLDAVFAQAS